MLPRNHGGGGEIDLVIRGFEQLQGDQIGNNLEWLQTNGTGKVGNYHVIEQIYGSIRNVRSILRFARHVAGQR